MCNKKLSDIPASLNIRQLLACIYLVFQNCTPTLYKTRHPQYLKPELTFLQTLMVPSPCPSTNQQIHFICICW